MGLEGMSMAAVDEAGPLPKVLEKVGEFCFRVFENMLRFDSVGAVWHADDIAFSTQLPGKKTHPSGICSLVQGDEPDRP